MDWLLHNWDRIITMLCAGGLAIFKLGQSYRIRRTNGNGNGKSVTQTCYYIHARVGKHEERISELEVRVDDLERRRNIGGSLGHSRAAPE